MEDLKKAFDAARVFKSHSLEQACEELDVSRSFLNLYFKEQANSAPLTKKVKEYITEAGMVKSIKDLGLDPDQPAKRKVKTATA